MLRTTLGQMLVNDALPEELRDYTRQLDKKQIKALFTQIAEQHPDSYREIAKRLSDIGRDAAYTTGGQSFGLKALKTPLVAQQARQQLRQQIARILSSNISDEQKEARILKVTGALQARLPKEVLDELIKQENPLGAQVLSGSRGNPSQLARLVAGDLLYVDHRGETIPLPAIHSYAEGLPPAEWFAASFGARAGLRDVKFATQEAGYFGKQLNQAAHRLMVTAEDDDSEEELPAIRGLPVDTSDIDNEGALLAQSVGDYPRNTVLTPKILKDLQNAGIKRILVRSPTVGGPAIGGVYAKDIGIRERGGFSPLGDNVGLAAAQAIGEKIVQGGLSSKHAGGVKGATKAMSGFDLVNQLIQVPKRFKGGATHAQDDGVVESIHKTPIGNWSIRINGKEHFVQAGFEPTVKQGEKIEAGDVLSEGLPNPAEIVKHKGIGEGRRYFIRSFVQAYRDSGLGINRRNVELLARGLIDHVQLTEEDDDHIPGDVVSYSQLERTWTPRTGYTTLKPKQAIGKYLERPVLHYTIGTKIRPSMVNELDEFQIGQVDVHDEPPPFEPHMVRAMAISQNDPDWMARLLGSYQKKSITQSVQRGAESDLQSTSFVPALAEGSTFGSEWPKNILKPSAASGKLNPK